MTQHTLPSRSHRISALFALFLACLVPLLAQDKKTFNLPAGPAADSLKAYATQSGLDVVFVSSATEGITTPEVRGELTPQEAIDRLLSGTPLVATTNGRSGGIKIRREASVELAEKNVASRPVDDRAADGEKGPITMDTFEVFAGRTLNMDIRRTVDDPQPYLVFDRQAIEESGAFNVEDFISKRLTSAAQYGVSGQLQGTNVLLEPVGTTIDLRGMGAGQTLILVDGRRAQGVAFFGNASQPDLSGIPLSAIDRIEVLASTASGIHGGSATGGVINIILKRDYVGTDVSLTYDNSFDTDSANMRADFRTSLTLAGGRTRVTVMGSATEANQLLRQDRDFYKRHLERLAAAGALTAAGAFLPPAGGTTNISSSFTGGVFPNLTLKSGQALNSPVTFVPYGYAGNDNGVALLANAGRYNLDLPDTELGGRLPFYSAPRTRSLRMDVRQAFSANFEAFLEAGYSSAARRYLRPSTISQGFLIPASAAHNPFSQDIRVSTPLFGTGTAFGVENTSLDATAGVMFRLPRRWTAEVDFGYRETKFDAESRTTTLQAAAGTAVGNGSLNVLRDTNVFPVDFSPYVSTGFTNILGSKGSSLELSARAGGPVWELPAGELTVSSLLQVRQEMMGDSHRETQTGIAFIPARDLQSESFYIETLVPVWKQDDRHALEIQLAGRADHYTSEVVPGALLTVPVTVPIIRSEEELEAFSPTVALKATVYRNWIVRASYGRGFLPPSLSQLIEGNTVTQPPLFTVLDPLRGNEPVGIITQRSGGNSDLRPEHSESWSVGMVYNPNANFRLSVDWSEIEKRDNIAALPVSFGTANIARLEAIPGVIERAAPVAGDPFAVGRIISFDGRLRNMALTKLEAMDLSASLRYPTTDWGRFELEGAATFLNHLVIVTAPGSAPVDHAGFQGKLRWRAYGSLGWRKDNLTVKWSTSYYSSPYLALSHAPDSIFGQTKGDAVWLHDVFASYRIGAADRTQGTALSRLGQGLEIAVGINNVLNEQPATALFSPYIHPRLSTYFVRVTKSL